MSRTLQDFISASTASERRAARSALVISFPELGDPAAWFSTLVALAHDKPKPAGQALRLYTEYACQASEPLTALEPVFEMLDQLLQGAPHEWAAKELCLLSESANLLVARERVQGLMSRALAAAPGDPASATLLTLFAQVLPPQELYWEAAQVAQWLGWIQWGVDTVQDSVPRSRRSFDRTWSNAVAALAHWTFLMPRTEDTLVATTQCLLQLPDAGKGVHAPLTVLMCMAMDMNAEERLTSLITSQRLWMQALNALLTSSGIPWLSPSRTRLKNREANASLQRFGSRILQLCPPIHTAQIGFSPWFKDLKPLLVAADAHGWPHLDSGLRALTAELPQIRRRLDAGEVRSCLKQGANPLNAPGVEHMTRLLDVLSQLSGTEGTQLVQGALRGPWTDDERLCIASGLGAAPKYTSHPGTAALLTTLLVDAPEGEGKAALQRLWEAKFSPEKVLAALPKAPPKTVHKVLTWMKTNLPAGAITLGPRSAAAFIPSGFESLAETLPGTDHRGFRGWAPVDPGERSFFAEIIGEMLMDDPSDPAATLMEELLGETLVQLGSSGSGGLYVLAADRPGGPVYMLDHHGEDTKQLAASLPAFLFRLAVLRWGEHVHQFNEAWDWVEARTQSAPK